MVGSATLDFGAFPGTTDIKSVAVTGQGTILDGSVVEAYIFPAATTDHTADEHIIDPPSITAAAVSAGTGFTIYGMGTTGRCYGTWNCAWVWV
jgi:hypothetical protein